MLFGGPPDAKIGNVKFTVGSASSSHSGILLRQILLYEFTLRFIELQNSDCLCSPSLLESIC